jgi:hypothetical protein
MTDYQSRERTTGLLVVVVAALVVGAGLTAAGQSIVGEESQDSSFLRVAHASPDAPAVDIYVNNESTLTDVPFGTVSDYQSLPAGTYNVTITAAGDRDAVVFDGKVTLEPREVYTIAASGEVSEDAATDFEPVVYRDNALQPQENMSAVSVIHLVPDAPTVDVTVAEDGTVVADNVSFRNASDYVNVPAGNYTLQIREATADDNGTVVTTIAVELEEETAYSAMAIGYLDTMAAPADTPIDVVLTEDVTVSLTFPDERPLQAAEPIPANQSDGGGLNESATEVG